MREFSSGDNVRKVRKIQFFEKNQRARKKNRRKIKKIIKKIFESFFLFFFMEETQKQIKPVTEILINLYETIKQLNSDQITLSNAIKILKENTENESDSSKLIIDCLDEALSLRWNSYNSEIMLENVMQLLQMDKQRSVVLSHPSILHNIEPKKYESIFETYLSHVETMYTPTINFSYDTCKCGSYRNCQFRSIFICPLMKKIPNSEKCLCNTGFPLPYCSECIYSIVSQLLVEKTTSEIEQEMDCIIKCFICGQKICPFEIITVMKVDKTNALNSENSLLLSKTCSEDSFVQKAENSPPPNEFFSPHTGRKRRCKICNQIGHTKAKCPESKNIVNSIVTNKKIKQEILDDNIGEEVQNTPMVVECKQEINNLNNQVFLDTSHNYDVFERLDNVVVNNREENKKNTNSTKNSNEVSKDIFGFFFD